MATQASDALEGWRPRSFIPVLGRLLCGTAMLPAAPPPGGLVIWVTVLFPLLPVEDGAVGRGPRRRSGVPRGSLAVGVEEDNC